MAQVILDGKHKGLVIEGATGKVLIHDGVTFERVELEDGSIKGVDLHRVEGDSTVKLRHRDVRLDHGYRVRKNAS